MFQAFFQRLSRPELHPLFLVLASVMSSCFVYAFFWNDLSVIPRYWDGPNYMYIAKTMYQIPNNHPLIAYKLTPAYFACHLPLYPMSIRIFAIILSYPLAMVMSTLFFTSMSTLAFYYLLKETKAVSSPFWSALISLFIPVRWLLYHSVGATEPLFLFLIIASMLAYHRKKYTLAYFLAGLASITRIVGILMGVVYLILLIREKAWKRLPLLIFIPLGLGLTFAFYHFQYNDFWAYFHWNAKLIHAYPFKILFAYASNYKATRPETLHSAEFYLTMYLIYGTGTLLLRRYPLFFWYSLVFFIFNAFIYHEDLSRYYIPLAPFALVVAYDEIIKTKAFKIASCFLIAFSYIYVWHILPHNLIVSRVYKPLIQFLN